MSSKAEKQAGQSKPRPIENKQRVPDGTESASGKVHEGARRKSTGGQRPLENASRARGSPQSLPKNYNRAPPEKKGGSSSRSSSLGRPASQVQGGQAALGKSPPLRGAPPRRGRQKGHRLTAEDWDDADEEIRDYLEGHGHQSRDPSRRGRWEQHHEELELEMALAMSLAESHAPQEGPSRAPGTARPHELSYERLATLEDIKVTATANAVAALSSSTFDSSSQSPNNATTTNTGNEMCTICQSEYASGDDLVVLPCGHRFHPQCASEWLLNYSKRCPVCKVDIDDDLSWPEQLL